MLRVVLVVCLYLAVMATYTDADTADVNWFNEADVDRESHKICSRRRPLACRRKCDCTVMSNPRTCGYCKHLRKLCRDRYPLPSDS
ncbi:hypothetical protein ElyMa_006107200 [Elysia marginata]|uniref:Uncharacterized protein n=1 Tax=Elysia marginata TaxID=1093978 RepID=A0AAV4GU45_9GAST|nr:hypothetical protein ElyMa_006107200 [Elysia marginata]